MMCAQKSGMDDSYSRESRTGWDMRLKRRGVGNGEWEWWGWGVGGEWAPV